MRGQSVTGKIQRNNYHHGSCGPSLTGKTMSVFLIFKHRTHRNVKNSEVRSSLKATFHLTISMRVLRATGKIQRNNYHHGSCEPSLTCKTSSVSLIFTQGTHRNVKNR